MCHGIGDSMIAWYRSPLASKGDALQNALWIVDCDKEDPEVTSTFSTRCSWWLSLRFCGFMVAYCMAWLLLAKFDELPALFFTRHRQVWQTALLSSPFLKNFHTLDSGFSTSMKKLLQMQGWRNSLVFEVRAWFDTTHWTQKYFPDLNNAQADAVWLMTNLIGGRR